MRLEVVSFPLATVVQGQQRPGWLKVIISQLPARGQTRLSALPPAHLIHLFWDVIWKRSMIHLRQKTLSLAQRQIWGRIVIKLLRQHGFNHRDMAQGADQQLVLPVMFNSKVVMGFSRPLPAACMYGTAQMHVYILA